MNLKKNFEILSIIVFNDFRTFKVFCNLFEAIIKLIIIDIVLTQYIYKFIVIIIIIINCTFFSISFKA